MIIEKPTLAFLKDLRKNNNRDWFKTNKPRYEEAKDNVEGFLDALIQKVAKWDPSIGHHTGKSVMFRIYRDVRFSKDKSPYKTHFGAHISGAEKKSDIHSRAGYYIHIGAGDSMIAGGAYMPQGPWIKNIRAAIDTNPAELKKILNKKAFKDTFGEIEGDKLKTAPKGYPKDHPEIELLRHKSFHVAHGCSDKEVLDIGFVNHAVKVCKTLYPFDEWLNACHGLF